MARKTKRRTFRRPRPQQRAEDQAQKRQAVESAARALLARSGPDSVPQVLADCELLLEEADRVAQLEPNPMNLARYRAAQNDLQAARAAMALLERSGQ